MNRRRYLQFLTGTAGVWLAGCGTTSSESPVVETPAVTLVDTQFDPRNIHVETGTTVTWTNNDSHSHTVTAAADNWEKDTELDAEDETTHRFETRGVYAAYCRFHGDAELSGMSMKISVGDAEIEAPLGSTGDGNPDPYG